MIQEIKKKRVKGNIIVKFNHIINHQINLLEIPCIALKTVLMAKKVDLKQLSMLPMRIIKLKMNNN